jgi:sec-independent protein translocase protein TatA
MARRTATGGKNAMPNLGVQELLVIFLIILVIFGASKLPQLGAGLGEGIRNFRKSLKSGENSTNGEQAPDNGDNQAS